MPRFDSPAHRIARVLGHASTLILGWRAYVPDRATPGEIDRAASFLNYGPDHLIGEEPVMLMGYHSFSNKERWDGLMLTSHRVVGWDNSARVRHPPCDLRGMTAASSFEPKGITKVSQLHLEWGSERREVVVWGAEKVELLLQRIVSLPDAQRVPADRPLLPADMTDPAGLDRLNQLCSFPSTRIGLLARLLRARHPALGDSRTRRAAMRVVLMHHNMFLGRGQRDGWWLSPVTAQDLLLAMQHLFGEPSGQERRGDVTCMSFRTGKSSAGDVARTAAKNIAGHAVAMAVGIGWRSKHRYTLKHVGIQVREIDGFGAFQLDGAKTDRPELHPLHEVLPHEMEWLLDTLRDVEADMLLRRILAGDQGLGLDAEAVRQQIEGLVPGAGADYTAFSSPSDHRDVRLSKLLGSDWTPPEGDPLPPEVLEPPPDALEDEEEELPEDADFADYMKTASLFQIGSGILNLIVLPLLSLLAALLFFPCLLGACILPAIGIAELYSAIRLRSGDPRYIDLGRYVALGEVACILCINPVTAVLGFLAISKLHDARKLAEREGLLEKE